MHKELESMSRIISAMQARIDELELALARARDTQEDIACGTKLDCVVCGKPKPCGCDKT